jgi:PAS domain S-box-containing protein
MTQPEATSETRTPPLPWTAPETQATPGFLARVRRVITRRRTLVPGVFVVMGGGWVILDHFVLNEMRGQAAYLPEVAIEFAVVLAAAGVLLALEVLVSESDTRLRETTERFRELAERSPDVIYRYHLRPAFGVDYVSPAALAVTGYAPAEFYADPGLFWRIVHPDDADRMRTATTEPDALHEPFTVRLLRKDGSTVWTERRSVRILDEGGQLLAIEGFVRDVTARIAAEAAIRERETQLSRVLDVSPDAFLIHRDGEVVFVNAAAVALLGASDAGELIGRPVLGLVHPADREKVIGRINAALVEGTWAPLAEERLLRLDGGIAEVEVASAPLQYEGQLSILTVGRDVSARRASEQALRASEERFRRITETITDYVYTVTVRDGAVVRTTHGPGSIAVTGYPLEDFAADPDLWLRMVVPEDREMVVRQAAAVLAEGTSPAIEHRIIRKDGAPRWVRNTPVPQHDETGTLIGYDGIIQDITERRLLEEQLRQAQKMEAIGQLAGGIAHDFNNLLTAIRGYAELIHAEIAPGDPARGDIDQVLAAADRAAELTRQLLAFSRRQVLQPQIVDVGESVARLASMLRRLLGEHIDLAVERVPGVGLVTVDRSQLEQVIVNLAVNARDAMPDGGRLTIEVADVVIGADYAAMHPEATPGQYVSLAVSDTGLGMDAETRAHVFEPFFTTKEPGRGTGMGLATVYGIVKQSGGLIYVYSEPGRGTTFQIYLPRADQLPADATSTVQPRVSAGTETILLVEDDGAVRDFARRALTGSGYTVLEAEDGGKALALVGRVRAGIDLLVTDVIMPGMNGRELAERLVAARPGLRVLFVSGFAQDYFGRSGVADELSYLPKPFSAAALVRTVRQVLDA